MEPMKKYVYGALIVALLAGAYAALTYVSAYSSSIQPSSFRNFSVTAQGKAIAVPDVAEFTFSVLTQGGKDLASLQSTNTTDMNKAIAFVKSEGVDAKDIQTSGYAINPRYQYYDCPQAQSSVVPCPPATIVGYAVVQNVDVKVRDFSKIGDILSGVVQQGANTVSALQFTIDDPTKVKEEARADAITKAEAQAQAIAGAAGFSVGRLLSINESGPAPMYYNEMMKTAGVGMGSAASDAAVPSIEPGSEEIDVTVTLQYEIK